MKLTKKIFNFLPYRLKSSLYVLLKGRAYEMGYNLNEVNKFTKPQRDKHFYGQYGEDALLWHLFKDKKDGFYVEAGAMEGIRFSNTFLFEQKGWQGVCIEPHPDFFKLLSKNRPGAKVVQVAAGEDDKNEVSFYTSERGSMSTLDKGLEGFFRDHYGKWFGGFKEIKVPMKKLDSILEEAGAEKIDLLSVDVEGLEKEVFSGLSWDKYRPRVVIAEISIKAEPVFEFMRQKEYHLVCINPSNAVFCRDKEDAEVLKMTKIVGRQEIPKHVLDN